MGNIAPAVGVEPTSRTCWASVLTIKPPRRPYVTTLPTPNCLCGFLFEANADQNTIRLLSFWRLYILVPASGYVHSLQLYSAAPTDNWRHNSVSHSVTLSLH